MINKIEGLVLSKAPFQERHLICKVLQRSGKVISIVFYGGKGGGKKQKGSTLEFGNMMKIQLSHSKRNVEIYSAKEWTILWAHEKIRLDYRAFSLLCFILECAAKFSQESNLHDESEAFDHQSEGLFRVISSSLYYLDQSLNDRKDHLNWVLMIFISKLILELGIFPDRLRCILSGERIDGKEQLALMPNHGGFAILLNVNKDEARNYNGSLGLLLWETLGQASTQKYNDLIINKSLDLHLAKMLFHYLSYQFQLRESDFKTASMIF